MLWGKPVVHVDDHATQLVDKVSAVEHLTVQITKTETTSVINDLAEFGSASSRFGQENSPRSRARIGTHDKRTTLRMGRFRRMYA